MCELMTIAAALVFTALHAAAPRAKRPARALAATALMFWGAALMWAVDCVANRLEGEPLLDLSREDALLCAIILAAGLLVFAVLSLRDRLSPSTP
jgi:hypothetical protein